MYNLKFASTYDFAVMRENNIKAVTEDYYAITRNLFCVADGVSNVVLKLSSSNFILQSPIEKQYK